MYNQTAINILNFTISSEHFFIISLSHFPPTRTLPHTPKQSQLWFFCCCCSTIDWMYLRNSYKWNHGIFHMRFLLLSIIFSRFTQVLHSSYLYIAEKYFFVWIYHSLLLYVRLFPYLFLTTVCFHILSIMNKLLQTL